MGLRSRACASRSSPPTVQSGPRHECRSSRRPLFVNARSRERPADRRTPGCQPNGLKQLELRKPRARHRHPTKDSLRPPLPRTSKGAGTWAITPTSSRARSSRGSSGCSGMTRIPEMRPPLHRWTITRAGELMTPPSAVMPMLLQGHRPECSAAVGTALVGHLGAERPLRLPEIAPPQQLSPRLLTNRGSRLRPLRPALVPEASQAEGATAPEASAWLSYLGRQTARNNEPPHRTLQPSGKRRSTWAGATLPSPGRSGKSWAIRSFRWGPMSRILGRPKAHRIRRSASPLSSGNDRPMARGSTRSTSGAATHHRLDRLQSTNIRSDERRCAYSKFSEPRAGGSAHAAPVPLGGRCETRLGFRAPQGQAERDPSFVALQVPSRSSARHRVRPVVIRNNLRPELVDPAGPEGQEILRRLWKATDTLNGGEVTPPNP